MKALEQLIGAFRVANAAYKLAVTVFVTVACIGLSSVFGTFSTDDPAMQSASHRASKENAAGSHRASSSDGPHNMGASEAPDLFDVGAGEQADAVERPADGWREVGDNPPSVWDSE